MKFSLRHQSTGKIYPYIVTAGHTMYWAFFRKVHIHNRQGVPSDRPVLLAANHPTAFLDPFLLCTYLDPPIYNMTRGDIFRRPFFRKLMESINMFPVYRRRDGFQDKARNDEVFEYCVDKLRQGRVVTIYVEGEHHLEKRVRPAQKGIARIAFAAYERYQNKQLQIVPAGCNYVCGDRWRDEAFVNIGEPLFIRDYWPDYQRDPGGAMLRLCRDIENALKKVCYHIENQEDAQLAEQLLTLFRSDRPEPLFPFATYNGRRFFMEKAVLDRLKEMSATEKADLKNRTNAYFDALEKAGLEDDALKNPGWGSAGRLLFFLIGFLPALAGYLSSRPVGWLADWATRTKVKKREFYSSVMIATGYLGGWFYYTVLFILALCSLRAVWIGAALLLPLLGWFWVIYRDLWLCWRAARAAAGHSKRAELLRLRGEIEATRPY